MSCDWMPISWTKLFLFWAPHTQSTLPEPLSRCSPLLLLAHLSCPLADFAAATHADSLLPYSVSLSLRKIKRSLEIWFLWWYRIATFAECSDLNQPTSWLSRLHLTRNRADHHSSERGWCCRRWIVARQHSSHCDCYVKALLQFCLSQCYFPFLRTIVPNCVTCPFAEYLSSLLSCPAQQQLRPIRWSKYSNRLSSSH